MISKKVWHGDYDTGTGLLTQKYSVYDTYDTGTGLLTQKYSVYHWLVRKVRSEDLLIATKGIEFVNNPDPLSMGTLNKLTT